MATTTLNNLVNPQVMADLVEKKLVDAMKFAPLATIDYTLQGAPGDTITLPSFSYIGDADVLGEASTLSTVALTASTVTAKIHKLAKGVEISDEAVLSGYGDPMGEAADQIVLSIASKMDNEMLDVLASITGTMLYETTASTADPTPEDISLALEKFGEDIDIATKVVLVAPAMYTLLRSADDWLPASEIAADRLVRGAVGEAYGCQVIVTNKLKTSKAAYIVMPGALRYFLKRDTLVESERDILKFCTVITASKHGVCYLYDASKAIKIAPKAT